MWFVLEEKTEKTVAMTSYKDAAEIIAANFPARCIIRFAYNTNNGNNQNNLFFENSQEMKKGA